MKKKILSAILAITISMLSVGCGEKEVDTSTVNQNTTVSASTEVSEVSASTETSTEVSTTSANVAEEVLPDFKSIACGIYKYEEASEYSEDEMSTTLFEINEFDGKYYIENLGDFDYGAGEIELQDEKPEKNGDDFIFNTVIHYFSGFSFAGDYHGAGFECKLTVHNDGSVSLSDGNPFLNGKEIVLTSFNQKIHSPSMSETGSILDCPEVVGSWRYEGVTENNEKFENYLELRDDMTAVFVAKTDSYPVTVNIGTYSIFPINDLYEAEITFMGETMGYANQPCDELVFTLEILEDKLVFAPFDYDKTDSVIEYYRTAPGEHKTDIAPGPTKRLNEVLENSSHLLCNFFCFLQKNVFISTFRIVF